MTVYSADLETAKVEERGDQESDIKRGVIFVRERDMGVDEEMDLIREVGECMRFALSREWHGIDGQSEEDRHFPFDDHYYSAHWNCPYPSNCHQCLPSHSQVPLLLDPEPMNCIKLPSCLVALALIQRRLKAGL